MRLTTEKGQIEGFALSNDFERAFQQNLVKIYGGRIRETQQVEEIAQNWEHEEPQSRYERLTTMGALRLENAANLEGVLSKVPQLQDRSKIEGQHAEQTQRELDSQITILYLKQFLAFTGICIGVSLLIFVGRAVIMKKARK